jgi:SAM-dependent methyltransferase
MENDDRSISDSNGGPASMAGEGTHELVLDLFRRFVPEPASVVDLAAGEGAFSMRLRDLGHDVRAVDVSSDHWKVPDIPVAIADLDTEFAASLSSEVGKFDAAVAIEIIEHLENPFRFVRECAKILKPGGLLFLTTPNVEAMNSRLMFLYTGRLNGFGAYETVRPAHITPIFKWKLDMMLAEAGFAIVSESYNRVAFGTSRLNLKPKITSLIGKLLSPIVKGEKGGEGRIVVARLNS